MLNNILSLGGLYATKGIEAAINEGKLKKDFVDECLGRYLISDWGDLCQDDKNANDEDLKAMDGRLLASYKTNDNNGIEKIWIITQLGMGEIYTTILLPEEY